MFWSITYLNISLMFLNKVQAFDDKTILDISYWISLKSVEILSCFQFQSSISISKFWISKIKEVWTMRISNLLCLKNCQEISFVGWKECLFDKMQHTKWQNQKFIILYGPLQMNVLYSRFLFDYDVYHRTLCLMEEKIWL